jgi:hypothetical protein
MTSLFCLKMAADAAGMHVPLPVWSLERFRSNNDGSMAILKAVQFAQSVRKHAQADVRVAIFATLAGLTADSPSVLPLAYPLASQSSSPAWPIEARKVAYLDECCVALLEFLAQLPGFIIEDREHCYSWQAWLQPRPWYSEHSNARPSAVASWANDPLVDVNSVAHVVRLLASRPPENLSKGKPDLSGAWATFAQSIHELRRFEDGSKVSLVQIIDSLLCTVDKHLLLHTRLEPSREEFRQFWTQWVPARESVSDSAAQAATSAVEPEPTAEPRHDRQQCTDQATASAWMWSDFVCSNAGAAAETQQLCSRVCGGTKAGAEKVLQKYAQLYNPKGQSDAAWNEQRIAQLVPFMLAPPRLRADGSANGLRCIHDQIDRTKVLRALSFSLLAGADVRNPASCVPPKPMDKLMASYMEEHLATHRPSQQASAQARGSLLEAELPTSDGPKAAAAQPPPVAQVSLRCKLHADGPALTKWDSPFRTVELGMTASAPALLAVAAQRPMTPRDSVVTASDSSVVQTDLLYDLMHELCMHTERRPHHSHCSSVQRLLSPMTPRQPASAPPIYRRKYRASADPQVVQSSTNSWTGVLHKALHDR